MVKIDWKKIMKRMWRGLAGGGSSTHPLLQAGIDATTNSIREMAKKRNRNSYPKKQSNRPLKKARRASRAQRAPPKRVRAPLTLVGLGNKANRLSTDIRFGPKLRPQHIKSKFLQKVMDCAYPPIRDEVVTPAQISAAVGKCVWQGIQMGDPSALATIVNRLIGSTSQVVSLYSGSNVSPIACYLENIHQEHQIMNSDNFIVNVRLYRCKARRDAVLPITGYSNIGQMVQFGFTDLPVVSGGSIQPYDDPNTTLYDNPIFTSRYKILSCKRFQLNPGENIKIEASWKGFRKLDNTHLANTNYFSTDTTELLFYQVWGEVSANIADASVTGIQYSQAKLDILIRTITNVKIRSYPHSYNNYTNNTTANTGASMQVINDVTGQPATYAPV